MAKNKQTDRGIKTVIGTVDSVYANCIKLNNAQIRSKNCNFRIAIMTINPSTDIMPSFPIREGDMLCISMYMNVHKSNKGNCVVTQYGKVVNIEQYGKNNIIRDLSNNSSFEVNSEPEAKQIEYIDDTIKEEIEILNEKQEKPDEKTQPDTTESITKEVVEVVKKTAVIKHEETSPTAIVKKESKQQLFLIDLENYADEALLTSAAGLPEGVEIHMFYTDRAYLRQMSLDVFENKKVMLTSHKSQSGDQELDKQLVSYLGYVLGTFGNTKEIIIVSRDKGYLSTINFWKVRGFNNIKLWTRVG